MTRSLLLGPAVLGLALLCLLALAAPGVAEAPSAEAPTVSEAAETPVSAYQAIDTVAGLRIYVDENGEMREPTVEEQKAFRSGLAEMMKNRRSVANRVPTKRADGTISMVLGMDGLNFSVLHYHADGEQSRACVDAHQAATMPLETVMMPRGNGREEM
ncbi:MAG: hypothetical protein AAGD01_20165 [Acidobacteriota bacterium]